MAKKTLKYFMREEARQDAIIKVPGPATIRDEQGNTVELEIKVLSNGEVMRINDMYKTRTPAKDRKGNYIIQDGELVYRTEKDLGKASRHLIVEALVYPDLKDPELMEYFGCVDITDMPFKVFPTAEEYSHVSREVMKALGMLESDEEKNEKDIEAAKN